jgi:aminopeptidase-like protein
MPLRELKKHLYSLPDHPQWIPYLTSYYNENWGFCLTHEQLLSLPEGDYEVCIDSSLKHGSLTYGECYLKGRRDDEILVSCYTCHPSLCNDNLSGVALTAYLAKYLKEMGVLEYSFRFLFIPETIGAITWLSRNEAKLKKIKHGLVVTCVGDPGVPTYKKSRRGNAEIDQAVLHVLRHAGCEYKVFDYFPSGSDERQYSSPAFDLPVGSLMRTMYGLFPEYHTSADDLDFIQPEILASSFANYMAVFNVLENNRRYLSLNLKCEPQLGKRGLYKVIGGQKDGGVEELAIFWVLNLSDGKNTLLQIAERSGIPFTLIKNAADMLVAHRLLREIKD